VLHGEYRIGAETQGLIVGELTFERAVLSGDADVLFCITAVSRRDVHQVAKEQLVEDCKLTRFGRGLTGDEAFDRPLEERKLW
jgi:hypothetical protein